MTQPAEKRAEPQPGPWIRDEWISVVDATGERVRVRGVAMAMSGSKAEMAEADANTDLLVAAPATAAERDRLKAANAELVNLADLICRFDMDEGLSPGALDGLQQFARRVKALAEQEPTP